MRGGVLARLLAMRACLAATMALVVLTGCASSPAPHPIVAAAAPAPPAPAAETRLQNERATEGSQDSGHADRQTNRAIGWVAVAIGAEAGVAAIVTSFIMLHENDIRNDNCADKVCSTAGLDANARIGQLAPWNTAGWIVGAAGLGLGAFLLLTNPSDRSLRAEVGATPSGVLLRGSF